MNRTYCVYILSNRRRTVLYIGVTNDLQRRMAEHAAGIGGAFTATYRAADLVYVEFFESPSEAIAREKQHPPQSPRLDSCTSHPYPPGFRRGAAWTPVGPPATPSRREIRALRSRYVLPDRLVKLRPPARSGANT